MLLDTLHLRELRVARMTVALSLVFCALSATAFALPGTASSSPAADARMIYCWPLTDQVGTPFLAQAQHIGSATDPVDVKLRSVLGLAVVAPSAIVPVTSEATCQHASQVIYAANLGMPNGAPLYMVTVGTHYLALAPTPNGIIVHLDDQFVIKGKLMQQ